MESDGEKELLAVPTSDRLRVEETKKKKIIQEGRGELSGRRESSSSLFVYVAKGEGKRS